MHCCRTSRSGGRPGRSQDPEPRFSLPPGEGGQPGGEWSAGVGSHPAYLPCRTSWHPGRPFPGVGVLRVGFGLASPSVTPGRDDYGDHDKGGDDIGGTVEAVDDGLPVRSYGVADGGQGGGPGDAPDDGVDAEPYRGHARDPGRRSDEGPDDRQQAADKDGPGP